MISAPILLAAALPLLPGEWFRYRVTVGFAEAGTASLAIAEPMSKGGRTLLPVRGAVEPSSFLRGFYRVRGEIVTWLDADGLLPVRTSYHREDPHAKLHVEGRQEKPGRVTWRTTRNGRTRESARTFREPIYDPIAALMTLRCHALAAGEVRELWLMDGLTLMRATATGGPIETLRLPVGEMRAQRIDGVIRRAGNPRPFRLWLTADAARLPVKLDGETRLGRTVVELIGYGREARERQHVPPRGLRQPERPVGRAEAAAKRPRAPARPRPPARR